MSGRPAAPLDARGYIDDTGSELSLTDTDLAAAGVLWPRSVEVLPGKTFASGSDAYGVIVGAFDEEGTQTVVRLLEVEACTGVIPSAEDPGEQG